MISGFVLKSIPKLLICFMRTLISQSNHYQLWIDENKQRLYVKLTGHWNQEDVFFNYLKDLKSATAFFDNQFDCHADFNSLKPFNSQQHIDYHHKALQLLINLGLKNSAQILPEDVMASKQILQIINNFGKATVFGESELLEAYLDSYMVFAA